MSISRTARRLNIGRSTLSSWIARDPGFVAALEKIRSDRASAEAALLEVLADKKAHANARVKAAELMLSRFRPADENRRPNARELHDLTSALGTALELRQLASSSAEK